MAKSALFVCLGNICRSPIAEACFKNLLHEKNVSANWRVDSAATSGHETGCEPDDQGQKCMRSHGIYDHVKHHRARQITKQDYMDFDFIFGMDESNMRNLKHMAPKSPYKAKLILLGSYDTDKSHGGIIEDPWGRADKHFETVYKQCDRSCRNFYEQECNT